MVRSYIWSRNETQPLAVNFEFRAFLAWVGCWFCAAKKSIQINLPNGWVSFLDQIYEGTISLLLCIYLFRWVARRAARVAIATPIFQILFHSLLVWMWIFIFGMSTRKEALIHVYAMHFNNEFFTYFIS